MNMNTNGNAYTIIYTTVVVALVAAILAFASLALAPKQDENVKADTISQMLAATKFFEKSELEAMGNSKVLEEYVKCIKSSVIVGADGSQTGTLNKEKSEIYTTGQLKAQDKYIKGGKASETPGLGAKIKDDPKFRAEFEGKSVDFTAVDKSGAKVPFEVVKGGVPAGQKNAVDAITGATITSKALGVAIATWLRAYEPYLSSAKAAGDGATQCDQPANAE